MTGQIIIAGFMLGIFSSFHCVGMCGPLALALPVQHLPGWQKNLAVLLYHLGRILTYTLLGLIFGLAGRRFYLAGFQHWLSIALGIILLVMAVQYFFPKNFSGPAWLRSFHARVLRWMNIFLRSKNILAYLPLGMANGLLPCGFVYLAIAGALTASTVSAAMLFMLFFGTGTLPAMMALSLFGMRISGSARQQIKKATPFLVAVMAVLLILRGLNLGIPFISPVLGGAPQQAVSCH